MRVQDERATLLGALIAVVTALLLTVIGDAVASALNGPGHRAVAAPVLWALGGGIGLTLGAIVASAVSRRVWPGVLAAFLGAVPLLVLVILGYNSSELKAEDQVVGSLVVVVLPAFLAAVVFAVLTTLVVRLVAGPPVRSSDPGAAR